MFFACLKTIRKSSGVRLIFLAFLEITIEKPEASEHHEDHRPDQEYVGQRVWPGWQVFELGHGRVFEL